MGTTKQDVAERHRANLHQDDAVTGEATVTGIIRNKVTYGY